MDKWYCIDNNIPVYAFGVLNRYNQVEDIKADVAKTEMGWKWRASSFLSLRAMGEGVEESKEAAQQAAEKFLQEQ